LIAAAVADQRSRVPQHPVRSKIAEILARQARQTVFFDRPHLDNLPNTFTGDMAFAENRVCSSPDRGAVLGSRKIRPTGRKASLRPSHSARARTSGVTTLTTYRRELFGYACNKVGHPLWHLVHNAGEEDCSRVDGGMSHRGRD
jgi:hypothetical protein